MSIDLLPNFSNILSPSSSSALPVVSDLPVKDSFFVFAEEIYLQINELHSKLLKTSNSKTLSDLLLTSYPAASASSPSPSPSFLSEISEINLKLKELITNSKLKIQKEITNQLLTKFTNSINLFKLIQSESEKFNHLFDPELFDLSLRESSRSGYTQVPAVLPPPPQGETIQQPTSPSSLVSENEALFEKFNDLELIQNTSFVNLNSLTDLSNLVNFLSNQTEVQFESLLNISNEANHSINYIETAANHLQKANKHESSYSLYVVVYFLSLTFILLIIDYFF